VILVAGVGYMHLSDLSFGPMMVERLQTMDWPEGVRVEDFSYGPMAILEWFEESPGKRFDRAIFIGAEGRGREPGTLSAYEWLAELPPPEEVQERVANALVGVMSLENLLFIAQHFEVLPYETFVVELEPVDLEWGMELSPVGERRMEEAIAWIRNEVHSGVKHAGNGRREEVPKQSE
jgi:hydrogenase maturation protease